MSETSIVGLRRPIDHSYRRHFPNRERQRDFYSVVDHVISPPYSQKGETQREEVTFEVSPLVKTEVRRDDHLCSRLAQFHDSTLAISRMHFNTANRVFEHQHLKAFMKGVMCRGSHAIVCRNPAYYYSEYPFVPEDFR